MLTSSRSWFAPASLPASLLAIAAVASLGCSRHKSDLPSCPPPTVHLSAEWTRQTTQWGHASLLAPTTAVTRVIPADEGSLGEGWNSGDWSIYYKFDSTRTEHLIERGPKVHDVLECQETIGGREAKVTTLSSTSNAIPGSFGQATWNLPDHRTFYVAVLRPSGTTRDSVLSVLRSVQFLDLKGK